MPLQKTAYLLVVGANLRVRPRLMAVTLRWLKHRKRFSFGDLIRRFQSESVELQNTPKAEALDSKN